MQEEDVVDELNRKSLAHTRAKAMNDPRCHEIAV
jgi:hypothetical protein